LIKSNIDVFSKYSAILRPLRCFKISTLQKPKGMLVFLQTLYQINLQEF
jgi:hypothetical protein